MPSVSKKIADCSQDWLAQISRNEIEAVAKDVQNFVAEKENAAFAFKCIMVSCKLVYNNKCSSPKALFEVVEACCNALSPSYSCDQPKLLSALYHVTNYFLKEDLKQETVLIGEIVIEVWKTKPSGRSNDEENTLTAFLYTISKLLTSFNFSQDLDTLCSSKNKSSALSLWRLLTALALCSNKKPLADLLCTLINITVQCNKEEKKKAAAFTLACLQGFLTSLEGSSLAEKLKLDQTILIRILRVYRQVVLTYVSLESVSVLKDSIRSVLVQIKKVFTGSTDLVNCIQFCEKVIQFTYRSMLDLSLDSKLLKECLCAMDKWEKGSELSYNLAYFMSNVLIKVRTAWAKRQPKLSSNVILAMIKLALRMGKFLDGNRTEVCSNCSLNCDETTYLQLNCLPLHLLVLYSSQNPVKNEAVVKFYGTIYKDLEMLVAENLNFLLKMQNAACPKFSEFYTYLLPFFSNSVCGYVSIAQYQNAYNLAVLILQKFAHLSPQFLEEYFIEKYLVKFITIICYSSRDLGNFDPPQRIFAAWIAILPSKRQALLKLWTNYKNDVYVKGTQMKDTIINILESNSSELKVGWNIPELSSEDFETILLEEVKAYWKYGLKYCEPCFSLFDASQKLKISIDNEAALLCILLRFLAQSTTAVKRVAALLDRVKEIEIQLCSLKKKSNVKEKVKINILLGCLVLARACCLILKIRSENETEFSSLNVVATQPKDHERGTEVNPNDFCTVVPALSYMRIDKQQPLFELLDEGVKYLSTATTTKTLESIPIDTGLLFDSIFDAGYICKLYGYETTEYAAWELGFKISCTLKNNEMSIKMMSNILGLQPHINLKWMAYTDALVKSLEPSDSFLKLCYALAVIKNSFLKQDYEPIDKLLKEINHEELKKHRMLYAEYYLLLSRCFFNQDISPVNCAVEAYICTAALVKDKSWSNFTECCKLNCLVFETSLNVGHNYLELMLPREVRHYVKSTLKLAQKLAVPLRLAEVLVQLTWVDIMCCDKAAPISKIQTLEEIFQLNTHFANLVPVKTGSRRTKLMKIEPPDFLKQENCQCFVCCSSMCQLVIIEVLRLQGAIANLHEEFRNYCMDFLKCAQHMLEKICRSKKKSEWMQLTEIKLFIQYVDHLCLIGKWQEATKINEKILSFINSFSSSHPSYKMLKQETLEQSFSLNCTLKLAT